MLQLVGGTGAGGPPWNGLDGAAGSDFPVVTRQSFLQHIWVYSVYLEILRISKL